MKIKLGVQTITAIDDGGVSLFEREKYDPRLPRVLSIEPKRKKHKKLSDKDTHFRHAAQIYAEMLGQVCHPEYNDRSATDYQEAFVIHARHATCYLFYARFPNSYLRNISTYGASYTKSSAYSSDHKILLQQSEPYRMYELKEQARFFVLLVKLFNYMASGKSHIGILCNEERIVYDCIVVQDLGEMGNNSDGELDGELDGESDASDIEDSMEIEAELEHTDPDARYAQVI